ncbi:MAG: FKBP-type peptidyl-prolyl cis-trans isomerase [Thiohalophilus sp.]|uniref:FKBP-type peptidyl-prolyl cis-trans isomerase n=1 Tax=Thiohalophilus sp. TaxID=3028392 RepID=UPI00286FF6BD|nr:FKBP-type peptidyl-prolyl cis-trans isomerase [Thiohalophilus sp.]MDR9436084.1 FKBP-type peptidyl-prolyl cis-trans isomerase [Thiohalophilus sp.]
MAEIEALTIGPGSRVTMHFTLSLTDGTVADSTEEGEPMTFTMGDGTLIEGLEMVLYGLKVGSKQCLEIGPRDTFGFPDEENIHTLPRSEFAAELPLEEGIILGFSTPSGEEVPGTIHEVRDEEVVVDFNHPLAGRPVVFDVEILAIEPGEFTQDSDI